MTLWLQLRPNSKNKTLDKDFSSQSFFDFIKRFENHNPLQLSLKIKKNDFDFNVEKAITQIACRQKSAVKLKKFLANPYFIFPDAISAEQASHQAVALFHASLGKHCNNILDMTAGLGIDTLSFAFLNKGKDTPDLSDSSIKSLSCSPKITAIEIDGNKASVLKHNSHILGLTNLSVISDDSIEFIQNSKEKFDLIYIDPSRRSIDKHKVFKLQDCTPDITLNQDLLTSHARRVLIKTSPLLDITQTLKDIKNITHIWAIGVKGECKELLLELSPPDDSLSHFIDEAEVLSLQIEAIDLDNDGNIISSFKDRLEGKNLDESDYLSLDDLAQGGYILEPSAMVMKLAPWKSICSRFNAKKFGKSSHLFFSASIPVNFPGRVSCLDKIINKQDRKDLHTISASIVSRNYPVSAEILRKQLKIKEGDKTFIYATKLINKPILLLSNNISFENKGCLDY